MCDCEESLINGLLSLSMDHCNECLQCGNIDKAYNALTRAVEISPDNPVILSQRGRIALLRKIFAGAYSDFNTALGLDGQYAATHSGLALYYISQNNSSEAERAADRALALGSTGKSSRKKKSARSKKSPNTVSLA